MRLCVPDISSHASTFAALPMNHGDCRCRNDVGTSNWDLGCRASLSPALSSVADRVVIKDGREVSKSKSRLRAR